MWNLLKRIHRDDKGAVSIETILIIAAITIPILIFILKFGCEVFITVVKL